MEETPLLADKFTPSFLMDLCDGLTDFQAYDTVQPFIGKWIRLSGSLVHATPNPQFKTAGVTLDLSADGKRRDAFLTFTRDLDRLAGVFPGDVITAEGKIKSIAAHGMTLEHCGLTHPQTVAILEVSAAAKGLQKAIEDRGASGEPITLRPSQPKRQSDPEPPAPEADKRRNLPPAEMEKFCKLLLAPEGWPSTTERVAHKKAVAFFPDNKVPVKAFLEIFRAIRGDRKPGPQPKTTN